MDALRDTTRNAVTATNEFVNKSVAQAGEATEGIRNSIGNATTQVSQNIQETIGNLSSSINSPPSGEVAATGSSFFSTNSLITKIAFVLLVVVIFLILFRFGVMIIGYMTSSQTNPYLIKGMISGNEANEFKRSTKDTSSVTIARSNNENTGAEYTWSAWLNVKSLNDDQAVTPYYSHVFHVGNNQVGENGIMTVNNAPGVYLTKYKIAGNQDSYGLSMRIVIDTEPFVDYTQTAGSEFSQSLNKNSKTIDITQLPFNNWFHLAIRLENTVMDIYINGTIAGRVNFETVPKQNFYNIFVCQNKGFIGNLSDLRYFSKGLNIFDINSIVLAGPNTSSPTFFGSTSGSSNNNVSNYDYISSVWYYNKL